MCAYKSTPKFYLHRDDTAEDIFVHQVSFVTSICLHISGLRLCLECTSLFWLSCLCFWVVSRKGVEVKMLEYIQFQWIVNNEYIPTSAHPPFPCTCIYMYVVHDATDTIPPSFCGRGFIFWYMTVYICTWIYTCKLDAYHTCMYIIQYITRTRTCT